MRIIFLYITLFILKFFLDFKAPLSLGSPKWFSYSITILSISCIILFIGIKLLKINKRQIQYFFTFLLVSFIILSIDTDYFVSYFHQNTDNCILPLRLLEILNLAIYPFESIFRILFDLNLINFSFILIPLFLFLLLYISKKISE